MDELTRRGPNKQRTEATRHELVGRARDLFLRDGYAATSANDIAAACGMTKGALYHHFRSKAEVLDTIVLLVQRELRAVVLRKASAAGDSWDRIEAGCLAYLHSVSETPGCTACCISTPWRDSAGSGGARSTSGTGQGISGPR